jgi:hypothetical protein
MVGQISIGKLYENSKTCATIVILFLSSDQSGIYYKTTWVENLVILSLEGVVDLDYGVVKDYSKLVISLTVFPSLGQLYICPYS